MTIREPMAAPLGRGWFWRIGLGCKMASVEEAERRAAQLPVITP